MPDGDHAEEGQAVGVNTGDASGTATAGGASRDTVFDDVAEPVRSAGSL